MLKRMYIIGPSPSSPDEDTMGLHASWPYGFIIPLNADVGEEPLGDCVRFSKHGLCWIGIGDGLG